VINTPYKIGKLYNGGLHDFHEGLASVPTGENKWGFNDKEGKFVISPVYDKVGDFSNGLAPVYKLIHTGPPAEEYKLLGYIDAKGTQYWEN
jgi:hypothetical protein